MSHSARYFHFTLGPVQSFVSQARRTRDFWAGSFLLSWLSAVAIKAVQQQGGEIIFPKANQNYLNYLVGEGQKGAAYAPKQGSIPNRFKAEIHNMDAFEPQLISEAVQCVWIALADKIWAQDIAPIQDKNSITRKIWERQIAGFWDMIWIISDDIEASAVLDQRKNWRSYIAPEETGVKCSIMDGWQELSGIASPTRPLKETQDQFWQAIRGESKTLKKRALKGINSDLKEHEALCAIAFVKRRFSRYFSDFSYTISANNHQDWQVKGWDIPSAVPSVSYMAAVHWLKDTFSNADETLLHDFVNKAHQLTKGYGEWQSDIKCIQEVKRNRTFCTFNKHEQRFKAIDGDVFFTTTLENPQRYEGKTKEKQAVLAALNKLNKQTALVTVSPFYAVLIMDGDSLGSKMSVRQNQQAITDGLDYFINGLPPADEKPKLGVADYVYQHNGFLIYAGGDDVLAILPLENAISCAIALRQHYQHCFQAALTYYNMSYLIDKKGNEVVTSISAAIEYVHIKTPLTKILQDAHYLLDDIAKEQTGRDALAIRVWKAGGLQQQWSQPWEIALYDDPNSDTGKNSYLEKLVADFQSAQSDDNQFSSRFFYKIREYFQILNATDSSDAVLDIKQATQFLAMEYIHSGETQISKIKDGQARMDEAKNIVYPLVKQCCPVIRNQNEPDKEKWLRSQQLIADGAFIVRFLAHKGVE